MSAVLNKSDFGGEALRERVSPCPALCDIVEGVWIQESGPAPAIPATSRVLPTGTVEILFHYGDLISHVEPRRTVTMPRSYVTGQRSRPVKVMSTGRMGIVIVSLYPWGMQTLLPGATEAADGYVDLREFLPARRVTRLEEQLIMATGSHQRIKLVESFLQRIRCKSIDTKMAFATQLLCKQGQSRPVHRATQILEMSERHFLRRFKNSIGLQPSVFMRIMRFQHAIRARRRHHHNWAEIAAECGYSDQSHLIRDMRAFSDQAPGQIVFESGAGTSPFNGEGASEFFDTVYM